MRDQVELALTKCLLRVIGRPFMLSYDGRERRKMEQGDLLRGGWNDDDDEGEEMRNTGTQGLDDNRRNSVWRN